MNNTSLEERRLQNRTAWRERARVRDPRETRAMDLQDERSDLQAQARQENRFVPHADALDHGAYNLVVAVEFVSELVGTMVLLRTLPSKAFADSLVFSIS